MSTRDLVNAIIAGDALEIESAFNSAIGEKLSVSMDAMRENVARGMFGEETEQLDELSKTTLGNYIKKAASKSVEHARWADKAGLAADNEKDIARSKDLRKVSNDDRKLSNKRQKGISKAVGRLTKEETELDEEGPSAGQRFIQAHRRPKPEDRIKKLETRYGKLTDHEQGLVHQGLDHMVHNLRNPNGPQLKSAVVRKEELEEATRTPEERLAVAKRNYEARLRSAQWPHERMDAKADYDHFHAAMQKEIAARKQNVSEESSKPFEPSKSHYIDKDGVRQRYVFNTHKNAKYKPLQEPITANKSTTRGQAQKNVSEEIEESFGKGQVTIHSPGHRLHGKTGDVFYRHDDGRVNVQVRHSNRKGDVTNLTLGKDQYKEVTKEAVDDKDLPFTPDKKKTKPSTPGKYGN